MTPDLRTEILAILRRAHEAFARSGQSYRRLRDETWTLIQKLTADQI